ncbi:MAG: ATP-binding cassette domain-containing protein [Bacilli bacterium]|nr:ATP-binding cassette domain-containing protein [Bacilli bacterium]
MIDIKDLGIKFEDKVVLDNVNIKFPRSGLICICGESGSGKTSLVNAISSLIDFKGSISFDGLRIEELNDKEGANFRIKNIGFIFQDFKLFDNQTVEKNVTFPLSVLSNCSDVKKTHKCNELLALCNLENYNKRICKNLSGGEKQRVAICRALINNPKLIIADEPTGSLDENNGEEILVLLKKFSTKSLVLMVTHDLDLARKYADKIVFIKNKQLVVEENNKIIEDYKPLIISNKEKQKKKSSVPFMFAINHAKQSMKAKKIRSVLSTMFMSMGLMGIGLSISFSNSISNDLKRSYSNLIETASISICKQQDKTERIKNVTYDDTKYLLDTYDEDNQYECGVGYLNNFEEMFKDCNMFYLESGSKTYFIDDLSIRHINDAVTVKVNDNSFLPAPLKKMEDDEICLGLTIYQIRSICMVFGIEKSVNSFSSYLESNDVKVVIEAGNVDWEYSDQQVFTLVGFALSTEPYIAHTNRMFNKIVLEDNMRFPSTDSHDLKEFPWVLNKITYISTENNYDFLKFAREKELTDKYMFEVCDKNLFVNQLLDKEACDINYLIPYYAPKTQLTDKEIEYISSVSEDLNNPIVYNSGGYVNYPNNLISGFANRTYFSLSEYSLLETTENNASIEFGTNEKEDLKPGVLYSNFSNNFANPVKFDSNLTNISSGREPIDLDEIVVSSGLLENLKTEYTNSEFLYLSTAIKEINKRIGIFNREYVTTKLKIVGVVENEKNCIYHNAYWTQDYFLLQDGLKAESLVPTSISFSIGEDIDIDSLIAKLKRAFPQYEIVNPLLEINKSVDQLCNAISIFILCISFVSLVISLILLSSCTYLHIQDIKKEIALARCIGINVDESMKFLYSYTSYSSLFALIVACAELTMVNLAILKLSSDVLSLPFKFSASFLAYVVMSVACVLICLVSSWISAKHIRKIKPIDCLKI